MNWNVETADRDAAVVSLKSIELTGWSSPQTANSAAESARANAPQRIRLRFFMACYLRGVIGMTTTVCRPIFERQRRTTRSALPVFYEPRSNLSPALHSELVSHTLDMAFSRPHRKHQPFSDLSVGQALLH